MLVKRLNSLRNAECDGLLAAVEHHPLSHDIRRTDIPRIPKNYKIINTFFTIVTSQNNLKKKRLF